MFCKVSTIKNQICEALEVMLLIGFQFCKVAEEWPTLPPPFSFSVHKGIYLMILQFQNIINHTLGCELIILVKLILFQLQLIANIRLLMVSSSVSRLLSFYGNYGIFWKLKVLNQVGDKCRNFFVLKSQIPAQKIVFLFFFQCISKKLRDGNYEILATALKELNLRRFNGALIDSFTEVQMPW